MKACVIIDRDGNIQPGSIVPVDGENKELEETLAELSYEAAAFSIYSDLLTHVITKPPRVVSVDHLKRLGMKAVLVDIKIMETN